MSTLSTARTTSAPHRLLITGARGFVGRHVVQAALHTGQAVSVIACDVQCHAASHAEPHEPRMHRFVLDVRDLSACRHVLQLTRPTHILHAAAITAGSEADLIETNLRGSQNMMDAAEGVDSLQRFLLVSSSAVYGAPRDTQPCDEGHSLDLSHPYARTKQEAEQYLLQLAQRGQVSVAAARIGPCYGPDEQPGLFRPGISLMGQLLRSLREGTPVLVGGTDYSRDWTHLDDISAALLALLFTPAFNHCIYNVSAGVAISAREILALFVEHGLIVQWTSTDKADLKLRAADGRKPLVLDRLRDDTGFVPGTDWKKVMTALLQKSDVLLPTHQR